MSFPKLEIKKSAANKAKHDTTIVFFILFILARKVYIVFLHHIAMKDPNKMTTEELIALADEIKGDMAAEWLKRREKVKLKPLLAR